MDPGRETTAPGASAENRIQPLRNTPAAAERNAHSTLQEVQHEIVQTDEHDNERIRDLERRVEEIEAFQNDHDHHATVTLINSGNASLVYWNGQYGYTVQIPKNPPAEAVHQAWYERWIQDIGTQRMAGAPRRHPGVREAHHRRRAINPA